MIRGVAGFILAAQVLGSGFLRPAAYRPKLTDNLVAYYKLDAASGADSHGTNTLTASASAPTSVAGKLSTAAQFTEASSQYFWADDNPNLSVGDIPFAVCTWVYLDTVDGLLPMQIFGQWDTGTNQRSFYLQYHPNQGGAGIGRFKFSVSGDGTIATVTSAVSNTFGEPAISTWHYICGSHEPGVAVTIQVDCGTKDSSVHTSGVFDASTLFAMGAYNAGTVPSDFLDGRLDSLAMWKGRIPSQEECWTLYGLGAGYEYPW